MEAAVAALASVRSGDHAVTGAAHADPGVEQGGESQGADRDHHRCPQQLLVLEDLAFERPSAPQVDAEVRAATLLAVRTRRRELRT